MNSSTVSNAILRLAVLVGMCECQHQIASKPEGHKLLALSTGGALLSGVAANILTPFFHHSTPAQLESIQQVVGEAIERICRRNAPEIKHVRTRWKKLVQREYADIQGLTSDQIVPLLTWQTTLSYEEMYALVGSLVQPSGPLKFFRRDLDEEGQKRLASALYTLLP